VVPGFPRGTLAVQMCAAHGGLEQYLGGPFHDVSCQDGSNQDWQH
jgi:hypothetical protein